MGLIFTMVVRIDTRVRNKGAELAKPRLRCTASRFQFLKCCIVLILRKEESVGKPGSVVSNHSSGTCVTACLKRPTRIPYGPHVMAKSQVDSYLVLLQVGFSLPRLLPIARCALTAPFHPYPLFALKASR